MSVRTQSANSNTFKLRGKESTEEITVANTQLGNAQLCVKRDGIKLCTIQGLYFWNGSLLVTQEHQHKISLMLQFHVVHQALDNAQSPSDLYICFVVRLNIDPNICHLKMGK